MLTIAWLTWLLLAVVTASAISVWMRRAGELIAPLPICLVTIAFYVLPRAGYLLWFGRASLTSAGLSLEAQTSLVAKTIGLTVIGVAAFLVGHRSVSAVFAGANLRFSLPEPARVRALCIGSLFWLTGFGAVAYLVYSLGGIASTLANQYRIAVLLPGREPIFELTRLMIVPTALLLVDSRRHRTRWWVWLMAGVTTVALFLLGRRAYIVPAVCYPIALYHLTLRRISARSWLVMSVAGALTLFSLSYVRFLGSRTLNSAIQVFANDPSLAVHFTFAANGELMIFDAATIVVRDVPSEMPYNYGSTIARVPVWAIPRAIWLEKPVTLGETIVSRYIPSLHTGYPPMALGDLYAGAGIFGVILGFACLGWIARCGWEWHRRRRGSGNASVYLAFCFFIFDYTRVGDPSRTIWFLALSLISMTLAFSLSASTDDHARRLTSAV